MRSQVVAAAIAVFLAHGGPALGQDDSVCEGVSCGGHGNCVEKAGDPVCACHEGYQADSVGLSCIPVALPATPEPDEQPEPQVTSSPRVEPRSTAAVSSAADRDYVENTLGEELDDLWDDYLLSRERTHMSFAGFVHRRAEKLVRAGKVLTLVVSPILGLGGAGLSIGVSDSPGFLGALIPTLVLTTTSLVSGIALLVRGTRRTEGLESRVSGQSAGELVPMIGLLHCSDGKPTGLALGVVF
jgi:hypothetical protein